VREYLAIAGVVGGLLVFAFGVAPWIFIALAKYLPPYFALIERVLS